jgi:hypothetical protein
MTWMTEENRASDARTGQLHDPLPFTVNGPADLVALRQAWAELDSTPCLVSPQLFRPASPLSPTRRHPTGRPARADQDCEYAFVFPWRKV